MKTVGFYKKTIGERRRILAEGGLLNDADFCILENSLSLQTADKMAENVIGLFQLPYSVAVNFKINGKEKIIPMVTEEPSVVAAASNGAKLCLPEGFATSSTAPIMIGQIQVVGLKNANSALREVLKNKKRLLEMAVGKDSTLVKLGGGPKKLDGKIIKTKRGKMLILDLLVDVRDAMGANAVNSMCEHLAPEIEKITDGKVRLRILSNLAVHRLAKAKAVWKKEIIGKDAIEGILDAYEFAANDQFRATTNNKGIMNGISAACLATGNDTRAIEAACHSYASWKGKGKYLPLAAYSKNKKGDLVGEMQLPIAVGIVGGATKTHPLAQLSLKILGIKTAQELAQILCCVGLANNFAALRALATEGIQRGHMELHARNVAIAAGAAWEMVDKVAAQMAKEKNVRVERAREILKGN
ncbi:MAG: hydroxymethylglutaryl-CoA reductase, degradative [Candidatus Micrarchaeota archaeon]